MDNLLSATLAAKLLLLYIYSGLSALYAYGSVRPHKAGAGRLLRAAPLIALNLLLPLILDHATESLLITPIGGVFSLAAFKASGEAGGLCAWGCMGSRERVWAEMVRGAGGRGEGAAACRGTEGCMAHGGARMHGPALPSHAPRHVVMVWCSARITHTLPPLVFHDGGCTNAWGAHRVLRPSVPRCWLCASTEVRWSSQ
jgi:hypothetical protein